MKLAPLLLVVTLLFSACSTTQRTSIEEQNENPLVAARYGEELADNLANLIIQKDRVVSDAVSLQMIQEEIVRAKAIVARAEAIQKDGMRGAIIGIGADVQGHALTLDGRLYLSSDFYVEPGVDLHIYLSQAVDPRDQIFPDPSAIDLGEIQSVYGAQAYDISTRESPELYRTIVLWDRSLKRLWAFGQLSKR